jgi:serine/threonine protein kinase
VGGANSFLVNLNHFRLLRVVGRGAFGKVRIVERKDTNLSFALKYIRKDEGKFRALPTENTLVFEPELLVNVPLPSVAIINQMESSIISVTQC